MRKSEKLGLILVFILASLSNQLPNLRAQDLSAQDAHEKRLISLSPQPMKKDKKGPKGYKTRSTYFCFRCLTV